MHYVDAMLRGFARANEDHWNVHSVTLFENRITFDIYFTQLCAELVP